MSVWDDLVDQEQLIAILQRAAAGQSHAMTHAWLFTGPPGSGRSNAARAFAAALQCPEGGCGACNACITTLSGAHPDVTLVSTQEVSIKLDEIRKLVKHAAGTPVLGKYQIIVIEDADRITERGADALLKSIEEPAAKTCWLLCAPTSDDVVVTIRSRCRLVSLRTPTTAAIAALLQRRDNVDPELAQFAARISQGHIGRAKAHATDPQARERRSELLQLPLRLRSLGACLNAASKIVEDAATAAKERTADLDVSEKEELSRALGLDTKGIRVKDRKGSLRELEEQQKARVKRYQRDYLDQILGEFTSYFRDVLTVQTNAGVALINTEFTAEIQQVAAQGVPIHTLSALDAIVGAHNALESNVAPLLAMETLLVALGRAVSGTS